MTETGSKRFALGAAAAGMLAAGAAAGVAMERAVIGRTFRPDAERDEAMGSLRGAPVPVTADDGLILHAEIDEPEDPALADLTVIFCHGYSLNLDVWHFQRRDLRSTARLVFWDQRSHGRSGRGAPLSHNIDQLGCDLARVIETCAPTGRIVLVGHSMGGMTIMALAAQFPQFFEERIDGVVLIATSSGGMDDVTFRMPGPAARLFHKRAENLAMFLSSKAESIERGRARTSDLTFLLTKLYSFGGSISPSQTQFVADLLASTPIDVVAEYLPSFDKHDKATALQELHKVETLVMVGDADVLTPPRHSHEIVRHVPGAQLVIMPHTGHMIITERYPEVNMHLRELFADVRRMRS